MLRVQQTSIDIADMNTIDLNRLERVLAKSDHDGYRH